MIEELLAKAKLTYKFLKKRGILERYVKNARSYNPPQIMADYEKNKDIIQLIHLFDGVACAFLWGMTPEGFEFWEKIELQLNKYLDTEMSFLKEHS